MDDNVRIFHMANGGLLMGSAREVGKDWIITRPMIISLRPHPTIPNKMQIMMQKMIGDPESVPIKDAHCVMDYAPGDKQMVTEYIRMVTGIELATEMPKGKS